MDRSENGPTQRSARLRAPGAEAQAAGGCVIITLLAAEEKLEGVESIVILFNFLLFSAPATLFGLHQQQQLDRRWRGGRTDYAEPARHQLPVPGLDQVRKRQPASRQATRQLSLPFIVIHHFPDIGLRSRNHRRRFALSTFLRPPV
ncbi:MAG: hypothetical protein L6R42_008165 [Xanthoria sp. 1 TBL-2021]|nr:MAG: hypothetical protein L6R42_008165 [Xanthoria sp. 1 TBL-2021]